MARPSKYARAWNKSTIPAVEELFRNGGSIVEACQIMGIGRETFYRWMKDPTKTSFRSKMEANLMASEAWWLRQGRENIGNRQFNATLYNLNMVNRFKWNSAQTEQTRIVHETKKSEATVDVKGIIDAVNELESKESDSKAEVVPLKVVDKTEKVG